MKSRRNEILFRWRNCKQNFNIDRQVRVRESRRDKPEGSRI